MPHFSRRTKIFSIVFASTIILGYLGFELARHANGGVPSDFSSARLQAALIAENIVNLSNQLDGDLTKVNDFDSQGKYEEALNITTDLIKRSQDIRGEAVKLSEQVEIMTKALSSIDSFEARQAALESISGRLALINRLINYSGYLSQLLETLRSKFEGSSGDHKVAGLINDINTEVNAINNFNRQAGEAMDRFDKIMSKQ